MSKLTPEYMQRRIAFSEACEARLNRGAPCEVCSGRGCASCLGLGHSTLSMPRTPADRDPATVRLADIRPGSNLRLHDGETMNREDLDELRHAVWVACHEAQLGDEAGAELMRRVEADVRALHAYRVIARKARQQGVQADLWEADEAKLIELANRFEAEDP